MTKETQSPTHHHGNLRQALIDAGLELLRVGGPAALTLRKCAAHAGVSHAAPANHFAGLLSLKVAIAARGHATFANTMRQHSAAASPSARDQLIAICEGYIAFAREHRTLFELMFQTSWASEGEIDETSKREKSEAAGASYDVLRQACLPFQHQDDEALNTETMVWSLVHGYAMLFGAADSSMQQMDIPDFSELLPPMKLRERDGDADGAVENLSALN